MSLSWLLAQPYPFVVLTKGEGPTTSTNLERNFGRRVRLLDSGAWTRDVHMRVCLQRCQRRSVCVHV